MPGPVSDVYPGARDIQRTGRRIPVSDAKRIAEAHGYDQVVVWAWDKASGRQHVTTYGKTVLDCEQAAIAGNNVKRAAGWAEGECNAMPARAKRGKR